MSFQTSENGICDAKTVQVLYFSEKSEVFELDLGLYHQTNVLNLVLHFVFLQGVNQGVRNLLPNGVSTEKNWTIAGRNYRHVMKMKSSVFSR